MRRCTLLAALLAAAGALLPGVGDAAAQPARIAGSDRYGTAAALSRSVFAPGAPVAFVATGRDFPDALAAAPAAALGGGPILLVERDAIPDATATELDRLAPGRIVVLGGTGVISDAVMAQLTQLTDGTVSRVAGADRYATAAALSATTFPNGSARAYVALASSYADALTAGAAGASRAAPVLLVAPAEIPRATASELRRLGATQIDVVGGSSAVSDGVMEALRRAFNATVTRRAGADRYATAVAVSESVNADGAATAYIATGMAFPDALAAAGVAVPGVALLLAAPTCLPRAVLDELGRIAASAEVLVGGEGALGDGVAARDECAPASPGVLPSFRAPTPLAPDDGASLNTYPRMTLITWSAIQGAAWYEYQWEWGQVPLTDWRSGGSAITTEEQATFEFIGAQPGRWRVRALAPGRTTDFSAWQVFFYEI